MATVANRLGDLRLSAMASSPAAIGEGKVWLLASSSLLADRPAVVSLIGFWIVGCAVFLVCSARVVVGVGIAGHLLSALGVYCLIGLTRLASPAAFASSMHYSDYGLSAIIGAWIGAIACVMWRRYPTTAGRVLVVAGTLVCAAVGLFFRPDLSFLDSEHVVAFGIGAALAHEHVRWSLTRPPQKLLAAATSLLTGAGSGSF